MSRVDRSNNHMTPMRSPCSRSEREPTSRTAFLSRWGTPLLVGPGSILDAHTEHEKIGVRAFEEGVATYVETARRLLSS